MKTNIWRHLFVALITIGIVGLLPSVGLTADAPQYKTVKGPDGKPINLGVTMQTLGLIDEDATTDDGTPLLDAIHKEGVRSFTANQAYCAANRYTSIDAKAVPIPEVYLKDNLLHVKGYHDTGQLPEHYKTAKPENTTLVVMTPELIKKARAGGWPITIAAIRPKALVAITPAIGDTGTLIAQLE